MEITISNSTSVKPPADRRTPATVEERVYLPGFLEPSGRSIV